ncbi:uncharacterized protein KIAA1671 homolog [Anolis sagrei]|uniref:uncharacterized protein KIAA1671 homolog n=1 Tax=Anolis sagrei TaxID=38937 RepID=UPI003521C8EF
MATQVDTSLISTSIADLRRAFSASLPNTSDKFVPPTTPLLCPSTMPLASVKPRLTPRPFSRGSSAETFAAVKPAFKTPPNPSVLGQKSIEDPAFHPSPQVNTVILFETGRKNECNIRSDKGDGSESLTGSPVKSEITAPIRPLSAIFLDSLQDTKRASDDPEKPWVRKPRPLSMDLTAKFENRKSVPPESKETMAEVQRKSRLVDSSKPHPVTKKLIGVDSSKSDPIMKKSTEVDSLKADPVTNILIGVDSSKQDPVHSETQKKPSGSIGIELSKRDLVKSEIQKPFGLIGVDSSKFETRKSIFPENKEMAVESSQQKKSGLIDLSKQDPVTNKSIGVVLSKPDPIKGEIQKKPPGFIDSLKQDPVQNETQNKPSGLIETDSSKFETQKSVSPENKETVELSRKSGSINSSKVDPIKSEIQKLSRLTDLSKMDTVKSEVPKPSVLINSSKLDSIKSDIQQPSLIIDSSKVDPIKSEIQKLSISVDSLKPDPIKSKIRQPSNLIDSSKRDLVQSKPTEASGGEMSESHFGYFPVSPDAGNASNETKMTNVQQRIKELTADNMEIKPGNLRRSFRSQGILSDLTKLNFSAPLTTTETRAERSMDLTRKYNIEAQEVLQEKEKTESRKSEPAIPWKSPQMTKTAEKDGGFIKERQSTSSLPGANIIKSQPIPQNPGIKTVRATMFDHTVERHTVSVSGLKTEANESIKKVPVTLRKVSSEVEKQQKARLDDNEDDPLMYQRIEPRYEILQTVGEQVRSEAVATVPEDKAVTLRSRKTSRERRKTDGNFGVIDSVWARCLEFQDERKAKDLEDGIAREMKGEASEGKKSWSGQHVTAARMSYLTSRNLEQTEEKESKIVVETENKKVANNMRPSYRTSHNKDWERMEEKASKISAETENQKVANNTRTSYRTSHSKDWEQTEEKTSKIPVEIANKKATDNTRDIPTMPKHFFGHSGNEQGWKDGNDSQLRMIDRPSVIGIRTSRWQRNGEAQKTNKQDESQVIIPDESGISNCRMKEVDERVKTSTCSSEKTNERVVIAEGMQRWSSECKDEDQEINVDERVKKKGPKLLERWRRKTLPHDAVRIEDVVTIPQERGKSPIQRDSFQLWENSVTKRSPKREAKEGQNNTHSPSELKLTHFTFTSQIPDENKNLSGKVSNSNVPRLTRDASIPKIPRPHHKRFSNMDEGEAIAAEVVMKSPQTETSHNWGNERVTDVDFLLYGSRPKSSSQKRSSDHHLGKDGYRSRVLDLDALMVEYKENPIQGKQEMVLPEEKEKLRYSEKNEKLLYSVDGKLQHSADGKLRYSTDEKLRHSTDEKSRYSTDEKLRHSAGEKLRYSTDEKMKYSADEKLRLSTDEKFQLSADEKLQHFADGKLRYSTDEKLRCVANPPLACKKTFLVDEEDLVPPQSCPLRSSKVKVNNNKHPDVRPQWTNRGNVNDENKSTSGLACTLPDLRRSFSEKARTSGSQGRGSPKYLMERGMEPENPSRTSISSPLEEKRMDVGSNDPYIPIQRRSRSFYRERRTDHWPMDQLKQCFVRPATGAKDTDNLVPEADNNQYGTWEERGSADNLPSTSSSLHMEQKSECTDSARIHDFSFLDPAPILDSSALKARVHLSKRRRQRRAPISLSLRRSRSREEEEEVEEKAGSPAAHPQRLPAFPAMDPVALKVQLRKRQEVDGNRGGGAEGTVPVQPPSRWREERSEEVPPQWLKELMSKRRPSQWENQV